jgi:hypothetical protein
MRKIALAKSTVLLVLLALALASCAFLTPKKTSAPEVPAPPAEPGSLAALRVLLDEADPCAVECTVLYTDPAVGVPLQAQTSLSFDGETGTLSYRYEKPNPIGADKFTSEVSGEASGDLATLSAALSGAAAWVWDATVGVSLPDIRPEDAYLATAEITPSGTGTYLLTATPTEGNAGALVGLALADASDLTLQICFSDSAVTRVALSYTLGDAQYAVAATFTPSS